jgi:hypothetical protein
MPVSDPSTHAERAGGSMRANAGLFLADAFTLEDIPERDKTYLAGPVATTTGFGETPVEARVSEMVTAKRQAADAVRKAVAHLMYWLLPALLIGYGPQLFSAKFTSQEGAGRPLTKGTGSRIADSSSPVVFLRNFDRVSGPEANSCASCHNAPCV